MKNNELKKINPDFVIYETDDKVAKVATNGKTYEMRQLESDFDRAVKQLTQKNNE